MSNKIEDGEYVLATLWPGGDPMDPWAFGFLQRLKTCRGRRAYQVVDAQGKPIHASVRWYRRAQRITKEFGDWLLDHIQLVEGSGRSLWWWKANYQTYIDEFKTGGKK